MARREPLGRDPLEWIKRTKPESEEEQPESEESRAAPEQPQAGEQQPAQEQSPVQGRRDQSTAEEPPTEVIGIEEQPQERDHIRLEPEQTERYALPITVEQQPSLLFPIIMIVCMFLMGYLVWLITSDKIRRVERKVDALTKRVQLIEKSLRR